jgi:hypothetical protein
MRSVARIVLFAALFVMLAIVWRAGAQSYNPPAIYATPLAGITKKAASAPIRNIGQEVHTIKASFPAAVAQVNGIQVQMEYSYDTPACATNWKPMGLPITTAYVLLDGTQVYGMATYYGLFPCLRVNSLTVVAPAMTVYYFADPIPGAPAQKQTDRYTF